MPICLLPLLFVLPPATAQGSPPAIFRDFTSVQRLRVVCAQKHYGRIADLIAEVPSGRLAAAVIDMPSADQKRSIVVPFSCLSYEAGGNLLQLGFCPAEGSDHPNFDPASVRVQRSGAGDAVSGTVLLSQLAAAAVALDGGTGGALGLTVELASGHVAFLEVAAGRGPAGDSELHPVPWAALRCTLDERGQLRLGLPLAPAALRKLPNLTEVILQDSLQRRLVYQAFRVPPPAFDRD